MIDCLLIYPKLGSYDNMIVDPPLSVLYAAVDMVKQGMRVEVLDLRVVPEGEWEALIGSKLDLGVRLVGVSVMTGLPLKYARWISELVRRLAPAVPVVWGGPHATVLPETVGEPFIDFLVRGYGSKSTALLVQALKDGGDLAAIPGLSWKDKDGGAVHNPRETHHEMTHYQDIPYHLVDIMCPQYTRKYSTSRMFPIFSAIGCPYRCSFCVHPTIYKEINGPKWLAYDVEEVIGHIRYVMEHFQADHIVFFDDTSFPDLERMRTFFRRIIEEKLNLTLEFRGARINEINRMDDGFLELMVRAGTRFVMVGVESGSPSVLQRFQKGITREQILGANRKLARYPEIIPHYNFIYGSPGETYAELLETKDLVMELLRDNPQAYFGFGGDWKPIPGTRMLEIAEEDFGYQTPATLDEWIAIDSVDASAKIAHPWYPPGHNDTIKMLQMASFVIDDKFIKETRGNDSQAFRLIRLLARIYKPISLFRMRYNFHWFMIEYNVWQLLLKIIPRMIKSSEQS